MASPTSGALRLGQRCYAMKIVVVESPAKAKTINKYLGKDYKVLASYGHIRDLPSKDGSVDPDNDFDMVWQADSDALRSPGGAGVMTVMFASDADKRQCP